MFDFSANHLFLFSRKEYGRVRCSCCSAATPSVSIGCTTSAKPTALCLAKPAWRGKVNNADKLYVAIESVRLDPKHARPSVVPAPADGAGGLPLD